MAPTLSIVVKQKPLVGRMTGREGMRGKDDERMETYPPPLKSGNRTKQQKYEIKKNRNNNHGCFCRNKLPFHFWSNQIITYIFQLGSFIVVGYVVAVIVFFLLFGLVDTTKQNDGRDKRPNSIIMAVEVVSLDTLDNPECGIYITSQTGVFHCLVVFFCLHRIGNG